MLNLRLPHDDARGNTRAEIELARVRGAAADASAARRENGDEDDAILNMLRVDVAMLRAFRWQDNPNGVVHDPNRNISTHFKILRCDRRGGITYDDAGKTLQNPNEFANDFGVFKVRWLTGPKAGAVEALTPQGYWEARARYSHTMPGVEPVPDNEPECPPARPANMPSSFSKCKALAAKALKKDPEDVTFDEAAAYFRSKLSVK